MPPFQRPAGEGTGGERTSRSPAPCRSTGPAPRWSGGAATLEIDVRAELHQQNGFLHGGVLSCAADNALTFAGGTVLGPYVLTGGFSIQYLRPATGRTLRARAEVVHAGRRQAVVRCDLHTLDDDGAATLCAVAQGTVLPVSVP
ncbi:PaaI family thioesterase [Streptomyces sp. NPDC005774]|uniref:PaaI family thioesterase n=1 Tax=Streptomyces sp. NPDC005774 TaxID=3364728 RepID=UPI00367494AF